MNIPKKIHLAGIPIEVVLGPIEGDTDKGCTIGRCSYSEQRIYINDKVAPKELTSQSFLHEVVHYVLDTMGYGELRDNEPFVDLFATFLYQVVKDLLLAQKKGDVQQAINEFVGIEERTSSAKELPEKKDHINDATTWATCLDLKETAEKEYVKTKHINQAFMQFLLWHKVENELPDDHRVVILQTECNVFKLAIFRSGKFFEYGSFGEIESDFNPFRWAYLD